MKILIANHRLSIGGGETYLMTAAEHLQRLGHDVTVHVLEAAEGADTAARRGLRVVVGDDPLPREPDVVYALDSIVAHLVADRFPAAPQVYNVLADEYDVCVPPQLPGATAATVVLHDRVRRRSEALAQRSEIVRLRQPVDTQRFAPRTLLRDPPRRVLLLGNYLRGDRRALVERVCAELGLECTQLGGPSGTYTDSPETALCEADIVVGKARVVLEAMACGRAVYVFDHNGGDGWVTPERYPLLEADNFGGQAEAVAMTPERLRADLERYRPEMGVANRDLAVANHSAHKHAEQLVALFRRVAPFECAEHEGRRELSRLVRVQWGADQRAAGLAAQVENLSAERDALAAENERLREERAKAYAAAEETITWANAVAAGAAEAEARERALLATRRVRLANLVAAPLDRIRRRRWRVGSLLRSP